MRYLLGTVAALPLAVAISAAPVMAQDRPDGIRAGAFYLQPSVTGVVAYNDNLFLEQGAAADSDIVMSLIPRIIARTARQRHLVEFDAGVNAEFHAENGADDTIDAHARLTGRYDVSRRTSIRAQAGYQRLHDNRGDDNVGVQAEPTRRNVYRGELAFRTKPNRMSFAVNGDIQAEDYEDADALNNDDDRDVVIYGVGARVGYEARKGYTLFLAGRYDIREFDDAIDDVGIRRGSDGWRVRAGVSFRPSPKVAAEMSAGYLSRSFDEPTFNDVDGFDVKANVDWELPNRNTHIGITLGREVAEATDADVAGRLTTSFEMRLTQRMRDKLRAQARVGYINAEEDGGAGNRDDDTYRAGVSVDYNFTRRVSAGAFYDYERRVSNEVGQGHVKNVVGVRLKIGY